MRPPIAGTARLRAAGAHASVLDQHNGGPTSGGTSIGVIGTQINQSAAEPITVGITGTLDRVEMYIYADGTIGNPFILDIVPVANGLPDTTAVLATSNFTPPPTGLQWISFDF